MASDMAENRYELSYRKIATNLNISLGTAHNFFRLFYDTGDVTPKKQPVRKVKRMLNHTDEIFVIGLIIESPSSYLSELALSSCTRLLWGKNISIYSL